MVTMKGLGTTMTKQPTIIILGDLDDIQKNKTWILFSRWEKTRLITHSSTSTPSNSSS